MNIFRLRPGLRMFVILWVGLTVSSIGSLVSGFGLGVLLLEQTGLATMVGILAVANVLPGIIAGPLAGVLVDRIGDRRSLLLAQLGAFACCTVLFILLKVNARPATLLLPIVFEGIFRAIQLAAFETTLVTMVPAEQQGRANGLKQLGFAISQIVPPSIGGALLPHIGVRGLVIADLGTFVFSCFVLFMVRVPSQSERPRPRAQQSALQSLREAWDFIRVRRGLVMLLIVTVPLAMNLAFLQVLSRPLVLGFTGSAGLGIVLSIAGLGMLAGAMAITIFGCPRPAIAGVLVGAALEGILLLIGSVRPSVALLAAAAAAALFMDAVVASCASVIWQRVAGAEMQGRISSLRMTALRIVTAVGFLVAGPLNDIVFERLLMNGGPLASSVGRIFSTGPGRGAALLLAALGALTFVSVILASFSRALRNVERGAANKAASPSSRDERSRSYDGPYNLEDEMVP